MPEQITIQQLTAEWITPERFKPYGQVISASADGKCYDEKDAQLNLNNGIPRFYIMRLQQNGLKFHQITRHVQCTQCLGALEGKDWFIAVCPPSHQDEPSLNDLAVFHIPGNCFIKLEVGTWHAGPYFTQDTIDFYNLELTDTNQSDHFTHNFSQSHHLEFEIVEQE